MSFIVIMELLLELSPHYQFYNDWFCDMRPPHTFTQKEGKFPDIQTEPMAIMHLLLFKDQQGQKLIL